MLVWCGDLNHCNVARKNAASVESLCLAKEDWNVVCPACLYVLAYIASYKEGLVEEDALIFLVCVRSLSLCVEVVDSYIFKLSCISSAAECLYKDFRGACNAAEMNMISGFDIFYSLIRTYEFNFLHIDYYCVSMLITILQKY